jgi:meso-butanediol dehydrogenase / (S,S)-butanediol dehydrogenase / diacetyl reductase
MTDKVTNPSQRQAVVITGGGSGIGRATAQLFAAEDADVLIVGRNSEHLDETAKGWPRIKTLAADVTEPGAPEHIISTGVEAFGRLDIVVNNAAILKRATLGNIDRDVAYHLVATNLLAPILIAQEAVRRMQPGGVIINITSNPSDRGWPGNSLYGCTKVALDFLTRTWAIEAAPAGIRVISIAPGVTDTPILINAGFTAEEIAIKRQDNRIPLGRIAQPEEMAWWIVMACRPEASYLTGQVIRIDGGASIC